jgi:FtsP/CotA-like multicopper oxidase with cupredoxin domain
VHWHGMHLPARNDGGPHQFIAPGGHWQPEWSIDQLPATLWYHPHPHGQTEGQVTRGLAGLFYLDDGTNSVLPHRYGIDDIPIILQDRTFDSRGQFKLRGRAVNGLLPFGVRRRPRVRPYRNRLRLPAVTPADPPPASLARRTGRNRCGPATWRAACTQLGAVGSEHDHPADQWRRRERSP